MAPKKSSKHKDGESDTLKVIKIRYRFQTFHLLIKWIGGCVLGYFVYLTLTGVAGQKTDYLFRVVTDMKMSQWLAWLIAGGCGTGWFIENKNRKATIRRLSPDAEKWQQQHDPNRSSSGLELNGEKPEGTII